MTIIWFGIVIALAAAVRSTWSPCGLSMLSQLTPMAEAGRRRAYGATAAWFVAGALVGGCMLGGVIALAAWAWSAVGVSESLSIALVAAGAFLAAAIDTNFLGVGPPFLRRQVNQDWLLSYRSWVYGGGFGWQIGIGVTTYVMTAAVPLMIVIGALGANPAVAFGIGALFGTVRGLAVLLSARLRSPAALTAFHRRFARLGEPVRQGVIVVQLAVAVAATWIVAPAAAAVIASFVATALGAWSVAAPRRARVVPGDATAGELVPV